MKEKIKNNKLFVIILCVCLLIVGTGTFLYLTRNLTEEVNDLEIVYFGRDRIKIKRIDEGYQYEKKVTIKNTSDELRTYSLEWDDVSNTFDKQYNLLYKIESTGERSATLDKSQLPIAESIVFPQVVIMPGKTQTYTIKIWYNGKPDNEKKSKFLGFLKVNSDKVDSSSDLNEENEL